MKINTKITSIASLLFFALGSNNALTQESENSPVFEEIVVTAQKREQSAYDVPSALSVFSAASLEKAGIKNLIDVGKFVPNLNVTSFGGGQVSSANPFIRGIGLQDHLITTDPGVGVYVDGVYLGRQIGQNWSLANIERIEVLRGPQGTLYGRNSIGGAINILTRKPGDESINKISLQAGSRGRIEASYFGDFKISDQFAVSASLTYNKRDGIGDFINVDTSTEVGESEDISGRISALWTPTDSFSLLIAADANDTDSGLGPYTTLINQIPNGAVFGSGLRNSDVGDPYNNATGQADMVDTGNSASGISLTADYEISENLTAKVILSTRESDYSTGLDDDSTIVNFLAFRETGEADQESFELQLNGAYGKLDFVSGLYYFEEEGFNDQPAFTFNGGGGSEFLRQELTSLAAYINVGYNISDRTRIAGGLRYTDDEKDAFVAISGLFDASANESFTELSWDISGTYEVNENVTAYASIANGYQSGQFNPRPFCLFGDFFGNGGVIPTPNCFDQDLENITALNYEVGIKGLVTPALQMSLALFYTDYSDLPLQVSNTTPEGFNTVNIIVDQVSTGIEWESSWNVTDGFFINTSLGYIDADVESDNPFAAAPLTPELTASISAEYTVPTANGALSYRADYSYRDELFGEPSSDPGRLTTIDSRSLLNLDLSYQPDDADWTVGLYGRNVTDERYENARLNTGDYVLAILSNDASEFGIRFTQEF